MIIVWVTQMFFKFLFLIFDYCIILLFFPIWLTLLLLSSIIILIIDGWPIFFVQPRIGYNNKIFNMIKLRTMKKSNINNELTLTRTGLFLRRSSIDEIPQFINIIKRDMSLVGPRPLPLNLDLSNIPEKFIKIRSSVLPGITGLSQINFTGKQRSLMDKVDLDIKYIKQQSFLKYFKVVILTFYILFLRYVKNINGKSL